MKNLRTLISFTSCTNKEVKINRQLERKEFETLKTFFDKLGGIWSTKHNAFIFEVSPQTDILKFITSGKIPKKNSNAFFPTPDDIITKMLEEINLDNLGDAVFNNLKFLEPSAGRGAIADRLKAHFLPENFDLVELDSCNCEILRDKGYKVNEMDFLEYNKDYSKKYDFIVTNPPYLGTTYIKHLLHAYNMLGKNGLLVAVIPTSFIKNTDKLSSELYDMVARDCITLEYIKNGFEKTNIETTIVCLRKKPFTNSIEGYSSYASYSFCLALINEATFYNKIEEHSSSEKKLKRFIEASVDKYLNIYKKETDKDFKINLFPFDLKEEYINDLMAYYEDGVETKEEKTITKPKETILKTIEPKQNDNKEHKQSTIFDFLAEVA